METFFVDTSAGNTALTGNAAGSDAFVLIKDLSPSTAVIIVNNFVASDVLQVHGYAGVNVQASATPGAATLVLSDGAQVTFTNVSVATLQQAMKVV